MFISLNYNKKSQVSYEMISFIILLTLIFAIAYSVIYNQYLDNKELSGNLLAKKMCNDLSLNIDAISFKGEGMRIEMVLPSKINGMDYSIYITNDLVSIDWNDRSFICPIITTNVNDDTGGNKGNIKIENIGGIVEIS